MFSSKENFNSRRKESWIKAFFGSSAVTSIVILVLIIAFLFKEGIGFFGENKRELDLFRKSGMEFSAVITNQHDAQTLIYRYLENILAKESKHLEEMPEDSELINIAKNRNEKLLKFLRNFQKIKEVLLEYEKKIVEMAVETKQFIQIQSLIKELRLTRAKLKLPEEDFSITMDEIDERKSFDSREIERWSNYFLRHGLVNQAKNLNAFLINYDTSLKPAFYNDRTEEIVKSYKIVYQPLIEAQNNDFTDIFRSFTTDFSLNESEQEFEKVKIAFTEYLESTKLFSQKLDEWNPHRPYPLKEAFSSFFLGRDWITNSARQDWYGVLPLFSGSLLISLIALVLAVPLGLGSAIYISQVAGSREQAIVKPMIEFIASIPSILIGFFGISMLGGWINLFADERLNSLTAGCLLALMTVPTIFTLAEDSLNNVSIRLREASYALGASKLQTCIRVVIPSALSGMISAVLLGFGRVIGETMVVLLCAGNRIAVPDFTQGFSVFAQPVHTMTGIIAQEMGEVEFESIHYRALFMVGIVLFLIALAVNFLAQTITHKIRNKS